MGSYPTSPAINNEEVIIIKNNSSAYNRDVSKRKALRKRRIARKVYGYDYYDNLHQYANNKIHCSCGMCRRKTNNKGQKRLIHGNYAPSTNYKISDLRRQSSMDDEELEYVGRISRPIKRRRRW